MFWLCYNLWVDWYGRLGWKEHFASPHSCLFGGYVYCYNCCHSNHNLGRVNNTLQNSYHHSVVPGWLPRFWGELTCVARNWYYLTLVPPDMNIVMNFIQTYGWGWVRIRKKCSVLCDLTDSSQRSTLTYLLTSTFPPGNVKLKFCL